MLLARGFIAKADPIAVIAAKVEVRLASPGGGWARKPVGGRDKFFEQFLCENRNPWYLHPVVGKECASCEAPGGKEKGEGEIFI